MIAVTKLSTSEMLVCRDCLMCPFKKSLVMDFSNLSAILRDVSAIPCSCARLGMWKKDTAYERS